MKPNLPEVRAELENIRLRSPGGELRPEDIVTAASNPKSVLHGYFEWDDDIAGQMWRLEQAHELIRKVKVIVEHNDRPPTKVRAYCSVVPIVETEDDAPPARAYMPVEIVVNDEGLREQYKSALIGELRSIRRRLEDWQEFQKVAQAIDEVVSV